MTPMSGWSSRPGVPRVRRGPGRRAGGGTASSPGHRHRAGPPTEGHRVRGAGETVPVLRDGHRGRAARACASASQLRPGDLRAGREPDRRAPHPHRAGHAAAMPAGWHRGLHRLDGRDPPEGRRAGGGQRVHAAGAGVAEGRASILPSCASGLRESGGAGLHGRSIMRGRTVVHMDGWPSAPGSSPRQRRMRRMRCWPRGASGSLGAGGPA